MIFLPDGTPYDAGMTGDQWVDLLALRHNVSPATREVLVRIWNGAPVQMVEPPNPDERRKVYLREIGRCHRVIRRLRSEVTKWCELNRARRERVTHAD